MRSLTFKFGTAKGSPETEIERAWQTTRSTRLYPHPFSPSSAAANRVR
jgi:hypothetical protein